METSPDGMHYASPHRITAEIGPYTYLNGPLTIVENNEGATVRIGKFCSVARNVTFIVGDYHRPDWVTTFPLNGHYSSLFPSVAAETGTPKTNGDAIVGNDVWIGQGATIMSGVTVGHGAVIAANAHVVKDVEPYAIVGGNPAKFIRSRFSPEQIAGLLEVRWWDFDVPTIDRLAPLLLSSDIDGLIAAARAVRAELAAAQV